MGNWLKSQKKARKDRKLDKNKSDRFKVLIEAGKLRWKPDSNIIHDQPDSVRFSQSLPFTLDSTSSSIPASSATVSVSSSNYQTDFSNNHTSSISSYPSSSSSNLLPLASSSNSLSPPSSPSSSLTFSEIKGSWILAFEALVR